MREGSRRLWGHRRGSGSPTTRRGCFPFDRVAPTDCTVCFYYSWFHAGVDRLPLLLSIGGTSAGRGPSVVLLWMGGMMGRGSRTGRGMAVKGCHACGGGRRFPSRRSLGLVNIMREEKYEKASQMG